MRLASGKILKIALLQAPLGRSEPLIYPLGIVYLAGSLPIDSSITLLDPNRIGIEETFQTLHAFCPDVIGVSIRNIDSQMRRDLFYYYLYLKSFLAKVRSLFPHTAIVAGGSGFSLFPREIMQQNPGLDYGVFLEGDESFRDLLENMTRPETVPGLFYRSNGEIAFSGNRELPSFEKMATPRYDLLDPKPYAANGGVGIQTKRGCPLQCIYCTYPHLNGASFRNRPIKHVIDEIEMLQTHHGVNEFTFVDGVFNLPKSRSIELLEELKNRNLKIRWHGWFTEAGFDKSFAFLCRDTGCAEFSFSPDGFSDVSLKALGKSIKKKDILNILEMAKTIPDIRIAFNFFWNPPEQTLGSFLNLMFFTMRCKLTLKGKCGGVIFGSPRIEPHTPLWRRAMEEGIIHAETDLIPGTQGELKKLFYTCSKTRYLDFFYGIYSNLWHLKNLLRRF